MRARLMTMPRSFGSAPPESPVPAPRLTNGIWCFAQTFMIADALERAGFADLGVIVASEEQRATLLRTLDELFATGLRDEWVARLRGADIVSAPINTLLEASNDPDVVANGYVTEMDYPKHGKKLKVHGTPWQFSETPAQIGIAPELGAHNDEILGALGYTAEQIQDLRERKII